VAKKEKLSGNFLKAKYNKSTRDGLLPFIMSVNIFTKVLSSNALGVTKQPSVKDSITVVPKLQHASGSPGCPDKIQTLVSTPQSFGSATSEAGPGNLYLNKFLRDADVTVLELLSYINRRLMMTE